MWDERNLSFLLFDYSFKMGSFNESKNIIACGRPHTDMYPDATEARAG